MKVLENNVKTAQIQSRLNKYSYLSKSTLPGYPDACVFQILQNIKRFPNRKTNPNFYHWYIMMKQFSKNTIAQWIHNQLYRDQEDTLISDFSKLYLNGLESKEGYLTTAVTDCRTQSTQNGQQQQSMTIRVMCRTESQNSQQIKIIVSKCMEYEGIKFTKEKHQNNLPSYLSLPQKRCC